jgi:hypothetical protein
MGKYLVLWQIDPARVPTDPKEKGAAWLALIEVLKADMKKGFHKDWGAFPAEMKGYSIAECTETQLVSLCMPYLPYVRFEVHPVISLAQDEEVIRASMK